MAEARARRTVGKLAFFAVAMFGFGFALSPLYDVFCNLTGLGGKGVTIASSAADARAVDRRVKIRFDASVNSSLPWQFEPMQISERIQLGKLTETKYIALNTSDHAIVGHATFNVTPPEASLYFVKTECFCFTEQRLAAHESREMPVFYYVQADLPEHIQEITLSYTFYPSKS
jgi:cytochrome c oxidase assembly protein subunit 11